MAQSLSSSVTALIPAVDQIDDQFDHRLLVHRFALGDHQRDGHQSIVGNPLRSIFTVKRFVAGQKSDEQGSGNAFVAVAEGVVLDHKVKQIGGLFLDARG